MAGRSYKLIKGATTTGSGVSIDFGTEVETFSVGVEITDPNSSISALSVTIKKLFDNGTRWHTLHTHVFTAEQLAAKEQIINFVDMLVITIQAEITVLTGADASVSIDVNCERGAR